MEHTMLGMLRSQSARENKTNSLWMKSEIVMWLWVKSTSSDCKLKWTQRIYINSTQDADPILCCSTTCHRAHNCLNDNVQFLARTGSIGSTMNCAGMLHPCRMGSIWRLLLAMLQFTIHMEKPLLLCKPRGLSVCRRLLLTRIRLNPAANFGWSKRQQKHEEKRFQECWNQELGP